MQKKFILYLHIISFLFLTLFHHCTSAKKSNIIGIYYKKTNQYNETEIFRDLEKIAFKNNFKLIKKEYTEKPGYKVIKEFHKNKVKIIILEDYIASDIDLIAKYAKKKKILLSHITDNKKSPAHIINSTDFEQLGFDIAEQLFNYTRSKRNTFVVMYNIDFTNCYRKKELLKGYRQFLIKKRSLNLVTNTYSRINEDDFRKTIYILSSIFSNNLRGILMDNDSAAVTMAHILRRTGKEDEIKISGFNATLSSIDSMMKTGLVVTGDINRYSLFHQAFTNSLIHYANIMNNNKRMTNIIPGVYYHQFNTMDNLSLTRKFSIKQIINNK